MNTPALIPKGEAVISGPFRYSLTRRWGPRLATVVWIMLNPSTADADQDDATIRRCIGFTRHWGYDRLAVVNLFAYRATSPGELLNVVDPVGPENDGHILKALYGANRVAVAWGTLGHHLLRDEIVLTLAKGAGVPVLCLGETMDGCPRHPLRLPASQELEPYELPGLFRAGRGGTSIYIASARKERPWGRRQKIDGEGASR